ncbi:MAG: hypothetical protein WCX69_05295 [Candidatus Paceibacterota bacterium]
MPKKQKLWFALSLAMFLIPEILWSPIANFYYGIVQDSKVGGDYHEFRNNFLTYGDNVGILKFVIFLQFLGLLIAFIISLTAKYNNKIIKKLTILLLSIFILIIGFVVLFVYNNNPQIG